MLRLPCRGAACLWRPLSSSLVHGSHCAAAAAAAFRLVPLPLHTAPLSSLRRVSFTSAPRSQRSCRPPQLQHTSSAGFTGIRMAINPGFSSYSSALFSTSSSSAEQQQQQQQQSASDDSASSSSSPAASASATPLWSVGLGLVAVGCVLVGCVLALRPLFRSYWSASMLAELERVGPASLYSPAAGLQPWDQLALNASLLHEVAQPQYIARLIEALQDDRNIVEVQKMSLQILALIAQDKHGLSALAAHPGVCQSLYSAAMRGSSGKEVSALSFSVLRAILGGVALDASTKAAIDRQREELLSSDALEGIARATRAWQPEVSGSASELLGCLVPSIHSSHLSGLSSDDRRCVFTAVTNLGAMYQDSGLSANATQCYRLALLLEPKNAVVMTNVGMEELKLGLREKAVQTLTAALKLDPGNGETIFHLYKTLLSGPHGSRSSTVWRQAAQQLRVAVASLQSVSPPSPSLSVHPLLSPCCHLLCKALEHQGRLSEAVQAANDWTLHCPSEAVAYFTLGRLLLQSKRYAEADEMLRLAAQLDASKPQTRYHIALSDFRQQRWQQAEENLQQAMQLAAQHDSALHALLAADAPSAYSQPASAPSSLPATSASLLCNLDLLAAKLALRSGSAGGGAVALSHVDRCLRFSPDDSRALILRAETLQEAGRQADAYRTFARALQAIVGNSAVDSNSSAMAASLTPQPSLGAAQPPAVSSSAALSSFLSRHRHTAEVVSGIAAACNQTRSLALTQQKQAAAAAEAGDEDETRAALAEMCRQQAALSSIAGRD